MCIRFAVLLMGLALATADLAQGAGFALIEQSVTGLGNAFAGSSASAQDASTIFYNPAGMTLLPGQQVVAGLHYVAPSAKFQKTEAKNALGLDVSGGNGGDAGESGLVPNLFYSLNPGGRLTFGLGITAPFGLTTEYPFDWVGRYHAVKSDLKTININPSLAFKVTDRLSLGAGLSAQYIDVQLTSMVDFGLAAFQQSGGAPALLPLVSNPNADVYADLNADDWGGGYNLGLLYEFSDQTRIGLAYRSRILHTLKGDAAFTLANQAFLSGFGLDGAALARFTPQGISGKVELPASASLGFFSQLTPAWAVMADVMWTDWSSFDQLLIEFDGSLAANPSLTTENWDDNWRYAVGASFTPGEPWILRLGLAYDQTPIPDAFRTPRIPGEDRFWTAIGGGYRLNEVVRVDLAYVHLFVDDSRVMRAAAGEDLSRGSLFGSYENAVDILSGQLTCSF
jgi:long-chain fatty acid transport protein